MSERAEGLAQKFEQVNNDLIQAVEQCSDEQWKAICKEETWPVGVTAHHIAGGTAAIAGLAQAVASGQELPPLTMEQLHQGNAEHAREHANCTKQETLDILRRDVPAAAGAVRALSDEQLDRSAQILADAPAMSAAQLIDNILIGHAAGHLESIRGTL